jgi:hypothetical protein
VRPSKRLLFAGFKLNIARVTLDILVGSDEGDVKEVCKLCE